MYVNADTLIKAAATLSALIAILTFLYKCFKWVERQKQQDNEISHMKEEQRVMCYALLAALDGLKQLGANGNVTVAYNDLEKHLNKSAHE